MAKNGTDFEQMMRTKQAGNAEYDFLRPGGRYNGYYEGKVKTEKLAMKFSVFGCFTIFLVPTKFVFDTHSQRREKRQHRRQGSSWPKVTLSGMNRV